MKERTNFHALWCRARDAWMANGYDSATMTAQLWRFFFPNYSGSVCRITFGWVYGEPIKRKREEVRASSRHYDGNVYSTNGQEGISVRENSTVS